jgi:hypothetical protein
MSSLASRLNALPGVLGYAVFDVVYRCPAHRLPPGIDPGLLSQTLLQLQTAFDTFAMAHGEIEQGSVITFVAECAEGSLALRRIGAYQIVTLLEAGCDPAPLVATLNEFSSESGSKRPHENSLEDTFDSIDPDGDASASSLEFYSASIEVPADIDLIEDPTPAENESIWTTGVKEIVGKLGRMTDKKKD